MTATTNPHAADRSYGFGIVLRSYPVKTDGVPRVSYEVLADGVMVARFLYLDLGESAEDIAMAYARGMRHARHLAQEKK